MSRSSSITRQSWSLTPKAFAEQPCFVGMNRVNGTDKHIPGDGFM